MDFRKPIRSITGFCQPALLDRLSGYLFQVIPIFRVTEAWYIKACEEERESTTWTEKLNELAT